MASLSSRRSRHTWLWSGCGTLAVHSLFVLLLTRLGATGFTPRALPPVEMDIVDKLPIPEPAQPEPTPAAPLPVRARQRPQVLPLPNRETPPAKAPPKEIPKPVFGVTEESVVKGDSEVAVPVGNTLMTKDRTPGPATPLPATSGSPGDFAPEPADRVASRPEFDELLPVYPVEAAREGVFGRVVLEVAIERTGKVRSVKVIKRAGHGMDEAAVKAMWKAKVRPAKTKDGRAVDWVGPHNVDFKPDELPE